MKKNFINGHSQLEKRLININEASEYLGIPKGSLYKMVWQRRVPFVVKIGRSLRFDREKIDKWILENTLEPKDYGKGLSF